MNTKIKMRMISLLLCIVMLVGLMPTTGLTAQAEESHCINITNKPGTTFVFEHDFTSDVCDLWNEIDSEGSGELAFNQSFSININDAIDVYNKWLDIEYPERENYKASEDIHNGSIFYVQARILINDYDFQFSNKAGYMLAPYGLDGEKNDGCGEWYLYNSSYFKQLSEEFFTMSIEGNVLEFSLDGTVKEIYEALKAEDEDLGDVTINNLTFEVRVSCEVEYYNSWGDISYTELSFEAISQSLYDKHIYESSGEYDTLSAISTIAPLTASVVPAYEGCYVPVKTEYNWYYEFIKEGYDEKDGEWYGYFERDETKESDVLTEIGPSGTVFGLAYGTIDSGDKNYITLNDILNENNKDFINSFIGAKPRELGGNGQMFIGCAVTITFADGKQCVVDITKADYMSRLVSPCMHACTICGYCTVTDEMLPCNFDQMSYDISNVCICDEPSVPEFEVTVESEMQRTIESTGTTVNVVVEKIEVEETPTHSFIVNTTNAVGADNVIALYNINVFDEAGYPYTLNQWGDMGEILTVNVPVSMEEALAIQSGEAILYHILADGTAEEVKNVTVDIDGEAAAMIFSSNSFSPFILARSNTAPYYGRNALSVLTNSTALLYAYDQLVAGVETSAETITVYNDTDAITQAEIEMVMDAYRRDYAHHFWLGNGYQIYSNATSVVSIKPTYIMTGDDLDTAKTIFEQKVTNILSGITSSMSEYEKELYLHDKLAEMITYEEGTNAHNAYGALVEGKAVCEGYAEALQYLLQRAGIQSFLAIGASINPSTGLSENHEWNYVRINDNYYHTDLTWDDQGENLFHAYFNQTDTVIKEDHTIKAEPYALPTCNATAEQYFTGKEEYLSTYTTDKVGKLLKDNELKVHVYIPNSIDDFLTWYQANISNIATQAGINSSFSYGYMQLGRELILTINIICEHTALTLEPAAEPYCTIAGYHAYYKCSCGAYFEDSSASTKIPDIEAWKDGDGKINALGHEYNEKIQDNNHLKELADKCTEYNTYWYDCSRCNANAKDDNNASDKYWTSTVEGSHSYTEKLTDAAHFVTGSGANCQDAKKYYYDCAYCDTVGTTTWASTTYGSHDFDETKWGYQDKNEGHAHKCKYCNEHDDVQPHIPGPEATEDAPQICTTCLMVLVPATGHICKNHLTLQIATGATCTVDGHEAYYQCSCNACYEDAMALVPIADINIWKAGDGKIPALGHDYTEKAQDEEHLKIAATNCTEYNTYWYDCSRCNANAKDDNTATDKFWTSTVAGTHVFTEKLTDNAHFVTGSGTTCQNVKEYYYDCAYCDTIGTSTWASDVYGEHKYTEQIADESHLVAGSGATCQDVKMYYYDCEHCNNVGTSTWASNTYGSHDFNTTMWGYQDKNEGHAHKCKYCNEHDDVQPHTPGAEATEEDPQICTTCQMILVPAIGHLCKNHLILKTATGATCTDDGHEAYYQCSCHACYEDAMALVPIADINIWKAGDGKIPALGHDYTEKIQDASHLKALATKCTEYDTYWYDCSRCDAIAKNDGAATDKYWTSNVAGSHNFTEKLTDNAHFVTGSGVNCQDVKEYYFDCVYCETMGTTTWASTTYGEHEFDLIQWGYQEKSEGHAHKCKYCNAHDAIQPHNPGVEATEDTDQTCTTCHIVLVPATGHLCKNHLTLQTAAGATCTVDGNIEYYKCSCGEYYKDALATEKINDKLSVVIKASHDYGELISQTDVTHTTTELKDGMKAHYFCDDCDTFFDENKKVVTKDELVIIAPTHSYGSDWGYKGEDGHAHSCSCGLKEEVIAHTPGDEATETMPQTCVQCGFVLQPALGHTHKISKVNAKAASCASVGNKEYHICETCDKWFEDALGLVEISNKESVVIPALTSHKDSNQDGKCDDCSNTIEENVKSSDSESPKTGDGHIIWLLVAILFVNGLGIIKLTVLDKEKVYKK